MLRLGRGQMEAGWRAYLQIGRGDSAGKRAGLREVEQKKAPSYWPAVAISRQLYDFETAKQMLQADIRSPNPRERLVGHLELARIEIGAGRWLEAQSHMIEMARLDPVVTLLFRAHCATLPFLTLPTADLQVIRQQLNDWRIPAADSSTRPLQDLLLPHIRLYLLGLLESKLGNKAAAESWLRELQQLAAPPAAAKVTADLARTIEADLAARNGRPLEVLALLEPIRGEIPLELVHRILRDPTRVVIDIIAQEHARYLRARSYQDVGRDEEALRWWSNAFAESPSEVMYLAPMHLQLGQIHDRHGRWREAGQNYARVVKLWQHADAALAPGRDHAQQRLAAVTRSERATLPADSGRRQPER